MSPAWDGAGAPLQATGQGPSHGYFCEAAADCHEPPVECFYPPSFTEDGTPVDVVAWFCPAHAEQAGFCKGCHTFWGGVETFEFAHPGWCDNCWSEIECEEAEESEDDDAFAYGFYAGWRT